MILCISVVSVVMFPLTCVIFILRSSFFPWWVYLKLCQFFYPVKGPTLSFINLFLLFSCSLFHLFLPYSFFFLLTLDLVCYFSNSLQYKVSLFTCDLPFFLMYAFIAVNFPLRTAVFHHNKLWCVVLPFSFVSRYCLTSLFISSLTHYLSRSMMFNFHVLVSFPRFLLLLSLVLYQKILSIISFFNLLRFVLWPNVICPGMLHVNLRRIQRRPPKNRIVFWRAGPL